jgi:glycosyltransferase involved in cell wall biosynthesis
VTPGPVPSFSVIIATYEAADFVGEAVASALDQTISPLEVIVTDDGSTDGTERVLEPYRDRIMYLRHDRNRGEAVVKNEAARKASGDFISILDSDDAYLPERIEALGELAAARPDLDMLTTDVYVEVDGEGISETYDEIWGFEVADQRPAILERCFPGVNPAVRRARFLEVGGFDESIGYAKDWECWMRLIFTGSRVGQVEQPLVRYRVREQAQSANMARVARGDADALEKAARTLDLTAAERATLEAVLAERRRRAVQEEARAALRDAAPDARRRSWAVARDSGFRPRTRLKAALATAIPGVSRRLLVSRERKGWVGGAGVRVTRRDDG